MYRSNAWMSVIRNIASAVGVTIIHDKEKAVKLEALSTLGRILSDLRGTCADEAWRAYLVIALFKPLSLNLRNQLLHGL